MKRIGYSTLIVLLLAPALIASERRYAFEQIVLDNGLKVITLEDHSCPIVAVQVWYHVGSKNEEPGRQGFAHMFEHMMFRGTDRLSETGHFDNIRRVGGDCNAYTAFDQTVYVQTVPSNQLELVLWLESERMAFLNIDKKGFETERKVVEEELRLGHNRPYGRVPEKLLAEVYGEACYGWTPGGQISHLRKATVEEVSAFWDKYYAPNNATLVVVGAVKHADVQALAKKYFSWVPPCPQPPRPTCAIEPTDAARTIRLKEDKGPLPILGVAYLGVPDSHPDALPLQILMGALGGGESSRLYVDIVKDKKIAQVALGAAFGFEKSGLAAAGGVLLPFGKKKELMATIREHVNTVRKEGITEQELEKMKNQLRRQEVEGAMTVSSKASLLGQYAVLWGDADRINRRLAEIDAVTLEDVRRVGRKYLSNKSAMNVSIEPDAMGVMGSLLGGKKDADDPDQIPPVEDDGTNRAAKRTGPKAEAKRPENFPSEPPIGPMLNKMPDLSHADKTLSNGLRVVVVSNHEVPMVSLMLGVKSGAWSETKPGVANAAMYLLTKGTTKHTAKELAEILESRAINLTGSADMDSARVNGSALIPQLDLATALMREVVEHPAFPREEFDLYLQQTRMGLMVSTRTPEYLADRAMRQQLYGDHPYSRTVTGELADIDNLKVEDLKAWWSEHLRPVNSVLYVAGDITPSAAFALAEKHFADWKVDRPFKEVKLPPIPPRQKTHIYLVNRPGSVQSQIRAGHVSIRRDDPDYFTSRVLSHIFGGGFNSRLNKAIRVEKGLTYGARGGLSASKFAGQLSISTFTKTPTTADTVRAILEEIAKIRAEEPTKEEITDTQSYLTGSFPGDRETPQAVTGDLWLIEREGLSKDYFERYLSGIRSADAAALLRSARRLIDPDHLVFVVVGEAQAIKSDLEKIAPVTMLDQPSDGDEQREANEEDEPLTGPTG
jgi:zinc protease